MVVYFTQHALNRFSERMVSPLGSIQSQLETALVNRNYSQNPPTWWAGDLERPNYYFNDLRWVEFVDADGVECVALVAIDEHDVVTMAKKNA